MCAMRSILTSAILLVLLSMSAFSQSIYSPEKGSPERKAIFDALRVPVEKDLKQKIVFVADNLKVQGNWAFASGRPTKPDGSRPDLSNTAWKGEDDLFDDNFFGLLRKTAGKWKVVRYALGCTDVCYAEWWKETRAPKTLFDITY